MGTKEVKEKEDRKVKKAFDLPETLAFELETRALLERRQAKRFVSQSEIVEKALRRYLEMPV